VKSPLGISVFAFLVGDHGAVRKALLANRTSYGRLQLLWRSPHDPEATHPAGTETAEDLQANRLAYVSTWPGEPAAAKQSRDQDRPGISPHTNSRITLDIYQQTVTEERRVAQALAVRSPLGDRNLSTLQHPESVQKEEVMLAND
jgi:hypothetical protein